MTSSNNEVGLGQRVQFIIFLLILKYMHYLIKLNLTVDVWYDDHLYEGYHKDGPADRVVVEELEHVHASLCGRSELDKHEHTP